MPHRAWRIVPPPMRRLPAGKNGPTRSTKRTTARTMGSGIPVSSSTVHMAGHSSLTRGSTGDFRTPETWRHVVRSPPRRRDCRCRSGAASLDARSNLDHNARRRRGAGVGRTGLTRNQVCPLGTQGSNPCLSANSLIKTISYVACTTVRTTKVIALMSAWPIEHATPRSFAATGSTANGRGAPMIWRRCPFSLLMGVLTLERAMANELADLADIEVDRVWNARRTAQGFVSINETARGEGVLVLLSERDGGPRLFLSDSKTLLNLGLELVTDALKSGTIGPLDLHRHLHHSDQLAPGVPKYLYPTPIPVDQVVEVHPYADGVRGLVVSVKLRDGTDLSLDGASVKDFANAIQAWLQAPRRSGS